MDQHDQIWWVFTFQISEYPWNPWARKVGNVSVADGSALVQRNYSSWAANGCGKLCRGAVVDCFKAKISRKAPYFMGKSMVSARF